ncbi:MAG: CtsR family transcriptional regulator [Caldicoprobacterales bacterium]|nr:CtsR family transcriptional regulator [Clostridiales bacterium]
MARLSDIIEDFIKTLLKQSEGELELQRNELAEYFECAPSQINYVLATRFSLDRGYYIESRRGGGGFIRIVQLDLDKDDYLLYLINERIGNSISENETKDIVTNIMERGIITEREAAIINTALEDKVIAIPANLRSIIRANILKAMLVAILRSRV